MKFGYLDSAPAHGARHVHDAGAELSRRAARRRSTVRGLNALHQLRRKQYTTEWARDSGWRDSEIARDIATRDRQGPRRKNQKRFPCPIVINPHAHGGRGAAAVRRAAQPVRHRLPADARAPTRLRRVPARRRPERGHRRRAADAPVLRPVRRHGARRPRRDLPAQLGRVADRLQADADDGEPGEVGDREGLGPAPRNRRCRSRCRSTTRSSPSTRTCTSC